jgi:hypothetical protein
VRGCRFAALASRSQKERERACEREAAKEPAWPYLLGDMYFLFLINALNKEDQRAEKRDDSAPDSHP